MVCFVASLALIFGIRAARKTPALALGPLSSARIRYGHRDRPVDREPAPLRPCGYRHRLQRCRHDSGWHGMHRSWRAGHQLPTIAKSATTPSARSLCSSSLDCWACSSTSSTRPIYSWASLAIFTVLLAVDFARIRNGGDGATATELAVSIYLDGLNIFLALTRIFSGGREQPLAAVSTAHPPASSPAALSAPTSTDNS